MHLAIVFGVLLMIPLLLVATLLDNVKGAKVTRGRVERFARRQLLPVTAANGNHVIRYLATTRRWRSGGITVGLLVSLLDSLPNGLEVRFITIFAGWFIGALVAEIRVAHLGHGERRTASLLARRPTDYVNLVVWALVPMSAALSVAVGGLTAVGVATGRADSGWAAVAWFIVSIALAVAVRGIQWYVLRRPQPLADPDVLDADDAIRSRALHVLSGGGAALVIFSTLSQVNAAQPVDPNLARTVSVAAVVVMFATAFLGWYMATQLWPPRRLRERASKRVGPTGASAGPSGAAAAADA